MQSFKRLKKYFAITMYGEKELKSKEFTQAFDEARNIHGFLFLHFEFGLEMIEHNEIINIKGV